MDEEDKTKIIEGLKIVMRKSLDEISAAKEREKKGLERKEIYEYTQNYFKLRRLINNLEFFPKEAVIEYDKEYIKNFSGESIDKKTIELLKI